MKWLIALLPVTILASSCTLFGRTAPVVPFWPPDLGEFKQDGVPFADDTPGLLDAAARLCTVVSTREQKAIGYRIAQRALDNLSQATTPPDQLKPAALLLARCAQMYADWEPDGKKVLLITQNGIDAARSAGAAAGDPHAAYQLAMNLGMHVRLIGIEAVTQIGDIVKALRAAGADSAQDQGGPLRVLGMLYLSAPAWPVGPGDPDTALDLLKQAAEKYPSHPQNHLFYAMALAKSGDNAKAAEELTTAANLSRTALWGDYAARWLAEIRTLQAKITK